MSAGLRDSQTPVGRLPLLAVAIGASAGGPKAIETVLSRLPRLFPAPIAVCQHMTEGATAHWAERLNGTCKVRVVEAQQGEAFLPGRAYIAPIGRHMRIRGSVDDPRISLERDLEDNMHVPAIDELMVSVAEIFGSRCLGVVLTGMGVDGAAGLLAIRRAGGATLAQPAETAFMSSMPEAAAELGAVLETVALDRMADVIAHRVTGYV
jgi:two-component system, chemotaxis family, protein-glutamate methylesterase/glutaminase